MEKTREVQKLSGNVVAGIVGPVIMLSIVWSLSGCARGDADKYMTSPVSNLRTGTGTVEEPLGVVARNLAGWLSTPGSFDLLREQLLSSGSERRAVDFRSLWTVVLDDLQNKPSEGVDTFQVRVALEQLPRNVEIYPYWKQRGQWELGSPPAERTVVVWWDSRQGDGTAVRGFTIPPEDTVQLTDGHDFGYTVIVVAVGEQLDQAQGYSGRRSRLAKLGDAEGDAGWIWQVRYVHVYNDHEPDWAEPPEFYVKAKGNGEWKSTSITPPVNNTSPWYFTKTIYDFGNTRPSDSRLEIWEDDGWGTGADDLVEDHWYYTGDPGSCSVWVDTYSTYERQCIGCYAGREADITVQVREN